MLLPPVLTGLIPTAPVPRAPRGDDVVAGNTAFACDLYRALAPREGNLVLAPHSLSVALAMTREGAAGRTAEQMDAVLHLPGEGAAEGFAALSRALRPPAAPDGPDGAAAPWTLTRADALWAQRGVELREAYARRLREAFGATLATVDFGAPADARATIDAWAREHSAGRIESLVPPGVLGPATVLVLADAIHLKAPWRHGFAENMTAEAPFTTAAGPTVSAPTMRRTELHGYFEDEALQLLDLGFEGGELSLLIALPRAVDGLASLEAELTGERLGRWVAALEERAVDVRLPRFAFDVALDLREPLIAAGMTDAFDAGQADFSRMCAGRVWIDLVLQSAAVTVDERGVEAAGATAVILKRGAHIPPSQARFQADHPFLFLVRHRPTGSVLFLGRVVDPTQGPAD